MFKGVNQIFTFLLITRITKNSIQSYRNIMSNILVVRDLYFLKNKGFHADWKANNPTFDEFFNKHFVKWKNS